MAKSLANSRSPIEENIFQCIPREQSAAVFLIIQSIVSRIGLGTECILGAPQTQQWTIITELLRMIPPSKYSQKLLIRVTTFGERTTPHDLEIDTMIRKAFHSKHCLMTLRRVTIWSIHSLHFLKPACSFQSLVSMAKLIRFEESYGYLGRSRYHCSPTPVFTISPFRVILCLKWCLYFIRRFRSVSTLLQGWYNLLASLHA